MVSPAVCLLSLGGRSLCLWLHCVWYPHVCTQCVLLCLQLVCPWDTAAASCSNSPPLRPAVPGRGSDSSQASLLSFSGAGVCTDPSILTPASAQAGLGVGRETPVTPAAGPCDRVSCLPPSHAGSRARHLLCSCSHGCPCTRYFLSDKTHSWLPRGFLSFKARPSQVRSPLGGPAVF